MSKSKLYKILIIGFIMFVFIRRLISNPLMYSLNYTLPWFILIFIFLTVIYLILELNQVIKGLLEYKKTNRITRWFMKQMVLYYYNPLKEIGYGLLNFRVVSLIMRMTCHVIHTMVFNMFTAIIFTIYSHLFCRVLLLVCLLFDIFQFNYMLNYYKYLWLLLVILTIKGVLRLLFIYLVKELSLIEYYILIFKACE